MTRKDTEVDTVKGIRKALKRVTDVMDATDENIRVYVRLTGTPVPGEEEFLLTGRVTIDVNGYVVLHADA